MSIYKKNFNLSLSFQSSMTWKSLKRFNYRLRFLTTLILKKLLNLPVSVFNKSPFFYFWILQFKPYNFNFFSGYGKFHYFLLIVCGFVSTSEEMDVISMSFILPSAQCDLNLNTHSKGWLNSIIFIGFCYNKHITLLKYI